MSDPNVREIQLGGKQLVFLFMASVVVAVAIFLLGISVGRGVGAPTEQVSSTDVAVGDEPVGEMPPKTTMTEEDRRYHDALQGQTPPPAEEAPPAEEPKVAAPLPPPVAASKPPASSPPATSEGRASAAATTPPDTTAAKPLPKPAAAPAARGWFVQVAAFKSRENADRQVSQLKAKGYAAVVQSDPGSLFRVRIGPFKDRAEATRTRDLLRKQDGITGSVGQ